MKRKIKTPSGKILTEESAKGVKGVLCQSRDGYFFRIYRSNGDFDDYVPKFADLSITIDAEQLASFYTDENGNKYLDETPETLGWEVIETITGK